MGGILITLSAAPQSRDNILRRTLVEAGASEIRVWKVGECTVLSAGDVTVDVADKVRSAVPCASVIYPVAGAPLASRSTFGPDTVVAAGESVAVGGAQFTVMAGPCAVETRDQLGECAAVVQAAGASVLRGGAFKPRTGPYSFQGTGVSGLKLLAAVSAETGLPVVSEVIDPRDVALVAEHVNILQIGTRNAQNFPLLTEAGRTGLPVLLKRGFGCTVDEWLHAAEYVLREGRSEVILCERGIRSFETATRFTLDLAAIPVVKQRSHLPIIVDPSHGTGHRDLVAPMALAAAAAGADGLLIDVHTDPTASRCDGDQALSEAQLRRLMLQLRGVLTAVGRSLPALVPLPTLLPARA